MSLLFPVSLFSPCSWIFVHMYSPKGKKMKMDKLSTSDWQFVQWQLRILTVIMETNSLKISIFFLSGYAR